MLQHANRKMSAAVHVRVSIVLSTQREAPSRAALLKIGANQKRKRGIAAAGGSSKSAHQTIRVISCATRFVRRCFSHRVARLVSPPPRLRYRKNIDARGNSKMARERVATAAPRVNPGTVRRSFSSQQRAPRTRHVRQRRDPYPLPLRSTRRSPLCASPANHQNSVVQPCSQG